LKHLGARMDSNHRHDIESVGVLPLDDAQTR
jgi:hypothetical protein